MSANTRSNINTGDYVLERLAIHSLYTNREESLKNFYRYIEIHEDLFSQSITAKLHIEDAVNFPEILPIIGQEKVFISFRTNITGMKNVDLVFRVYKMDSQKINEAGKSQEYVLHLISECGYLNTTQRCGYSLSGNTTSMVVSVFEKHFPPALWKERLYLEPTNDYYSFVLPVTYTPFKALNFLATKAYSDSGNGYTPYLFYENLDGYNFRSIRDIVAFAPYPREKYHHTVANIPVQLIGSKLHSHKMQKIQSMEELNRFDSASNIINGVVSSHLDTHDLVRKQYRSAVFTEQDVFESKPKLGKELLFRSNNGEEIDRVKQGASYHYLPSTSATVYTKQNNIVDNFKVEPLFMKRKYHMNSMFTQQLTMQVFGDSRRRVGDIVELDVPKPQADVTQLDDTTDKNLSGDYMITAIKHTLSTLYSCRYELSRNCMGV